jgi:hypothetical protein
MALFTDGSPAEIHDLRRFDNACEEVAKDAGIDLEQKLEVAAEEVGQEIFGFLLFQGIHDSRAARHARGLEDVVVTAPVRRWHIARTLAALYRDAANNEVNDRYGKKWAEYERIAHEASEHAFAAGIGLARTPVPRAPIAAFAQTGASDERAERKVQVTWVAPDGTEGSPSAEAYVDLAPGDVLSPGGPVPEGVSGWNIYVGIGDAVSLLQNERPLSVGVSWQVPRTLEPGRAVRDRQDPDYFVVERRILPRG